MERFSSHILAAVLFLFVFTTSMDSASAARPTAEGTNTEFIRTSCSATTYPRLCYTSLSIHVAAIRQDPKLLALTASITLDTALSTSTMMGKLSHIRSMTRKQVGAMQDCVEHLSDSADQLRRAMTEMNEIKGSNFGMIMSDVQTWVSAALTDEDTCTEVFAGKVMNGNVKTAVRERIMNVTHLTSNALALINSYASLHN